MCHAREGWSVFETGEDLALLDRTVAEAPDRPAVFLLWPAEGGPYLARTALLRRRLARLLNDRERPSRFLNLRRAVRRVEYILTGSALESSVRMYETARSCFPETYLKMVRLRMPSYIKILLANPFPRSTVGTHLGRRQALYYGPFRSRASAEKFESRFLDLFQMRRCQEDLSPSPGHPGCMYGEMNMCLRPCQQVVGPGEYAHEVARAADFLATGGRSLLASIARDRDRLSEEMAFEEAARQHKRCEQVQEVLKLSDDLARDLDRLHGIAITPSVAPSAVELWLVRHGNWLGSRRFSFEVEEGRTVSLDRKLRECLATVEPRNLALRERQECLALLARWYYSSWREGEWISVDDLESIPYRRLVRAISRVAHPATLHF